MNELNLAAHAVSIVIEHGTHHTGATHRNTQPSGCLKSAATELIELASSFTREQRLEELADVFICLLHFKQKLGVTDNELAWHIISKLRLRNKLPPKHAKILANLLDQISEGK